MQPYERLENAFAEFAIKEHAISCNTGTAGLHLALLALNISEGDEVIVCDFVMAACAFAISYVGATPIVVDCDENLNIDVSKIREKVSSKTKAIMAVHTYGRECNMKIICNIAKEFDIKVIVDMSEAHGIPCTGDIAVYSLYRNKIVCAEEGGIIVTNNKVYADKMRDLKNMAFGKVHNFFHSEIGYNYRMSNLQAELALTSLKDIKDNLSKRKQVNDWYNEYLAHFVEHDVDWVHDFLVENNSIVDKLPEARYFFKPISSFPMYSGKEGYAYEISKHGMYLPIDPTYTKEKVKDICKRYTQLSY